MHQSVALKQEKGRGSRRQTMKEVGDEEMELLKVYIIGGDSYLAREIFKLACCKGTKETSLGDSCTR